MSLRAIALTLFILHCGYLCLLSFFSICLFRNLFYILFNDPTFILLIISILCFLSSSLLSALYFSFPSIYFGYSYWSLKTSWDGKSLISVFLLELGHNERTIRHFNYIYLPRHFIYAIIVYNMYILCCACIYIPYVWDIYIYIDRYRYI